MKRDEIKVGEVYVMRASPVLRLETARVIAEKDGKFKVEPVECCRDNEDGELVYSPAVFASRA